MNMHDMRRIAVLASCVALVALAACSGSNSGAGQKSNSQPPEIQSVEISPGHDVRVGETETVTATVFAVDPDSPGLVNGANLTVAWVQLLGPRIVLRSPFSFTTAFALPGNAELGEGGVVTLQVLVSDGVNEVSRQVEIRISPSSGPGGNQTAVSAGADQEVDAGDVVQLQALVDPVLDNLVYRWRQIGGPEVSLSGADSAQAQFIAPDADPENPIANRILDFSVDVRLGGNGVVISSDSVRVAVRPMPRLAGPTNLYVALNSAATQNDIHKFVEQAPGMMNYVYERRFESLDNEGLALDLAGNAVHVGDDDDDVDDARPDGTQDMTGGLSHLCRIGRRLTDARFEDHVIDRDIRGAYSVPGLLESNNPGLGRMPGGKGVTYAYRRGFLIVANFASRNIKVFGSAAEGNVSAFATVSLGADPWDVAYDEDRDILYVASTSGAIQVLDGFLDRLEAGESAAVSRTIQIVDSQGQVRGRNLHGIAHEALGDRLVVSDIGAEQDDADGAIYVFSNARLLSGKSAPQWVREGPATGLGNPVDVQINGRDLLVAEKANNAVLVFADIFKFAPADTPPLRRIEVDGPESLALEILNPPARFGVTDLRQPAPIAAVLVGFQSGINYGIARLAPTLGNDAIEAYFASAHGTRAYGMVLDVNGDAYLLNTTTRQLQGPGDSSLESGESGAVTVINRLLQRMSSSQDAFNLHDGYRSTRDRHWQAASGSEDDPHLQAPRGVDIAEDLGLLFITDAAPTESSGNFTELEIFSTCGTGERLDQVAISTLSFEFDMGLPWGLDFDPGSGDLYVAMQNGYVAVFRNFDVLYPSNPDPSFILKPQRVDPQTGVLSDATSNLRGIVYDAVSDSLILADIGSASDKDDGQIVIIANASVSGAEPIADRIFSGPGDLIRNPVAIAFDGTSLYVLDDAYKLVLRYDDLLSQTGTAIQPSAQSALSDLNGLPRALVLVPDYLGEVPRQRAAD